MIPKRNFTMSYETFVSLVTQAPATETISTSIVPTTTDIYTSILPTTSAASTTNAVTTYWQNSGKLQ
jgi:hypothetical protein